MATVAATPCPSCQGAMDVHVLPGSSGEIELDLCFHCHGMWLDPQENLKLAPAGVVELFRVLHQHREQARQPLSQKLSCPHCHITLTSGFDVVRSGRYITYRCPQRHGRFAAFTSFMIEKGFVRLLTQPEINDIARKVAVIHCTSCGAPVDIRQDHACPHCRSAFSLIDPAAVERAMQGYAKAIKQPGDIKLPALADALILLERDRQRAAREGQARQGAWLSADGGSLDLWAVGLAAVWKMLD